MPLTLPPLNALRAFEAAARTGSYVAAAEELGVSAAAISQHIRKLEDFLGKEMFLRLNNRVILTDAGHAIFAGTSEALQSISDATGQLMSDRSRTRLVISALESVADKWLLPHLVDYARANPGFRFDLRVEPDPVDFARHNIDLRLCYGLGHYPGHRVQPLAQDVVQPMCSPAYRDNHPDLAFGLGGVLAGDLLHTSWGPSFASNPTWRLWHQKAGLKPLSETEGFQVGRSGLALDMAREGMGVALAQRMMASADLAAGHLVILSEVSLALGHPYCLAYPHSKARKRDLAGLCIWLSDCAVHALGFDAS
ncbi:MAG: LysR substrate-binding domain-containing protein [Cypionkella sp.]